MLAPETGAGEEFLQSAARIAGDTAGNKGSAGKSAGSSAALICSTNNGTASSTLPVLPLFPALSAAVPLRITAVVGPLSLKKLLRDGAGGISNWPEFGSLSLQDGDIMSGFPQRGVEFKGGGLHDGFGSSGEHLALLLLALQNTVQRGIKT